MFMRLGTVSLLTLCALFVLTEGEADARRLALIVGSNAAPAGKTRLRFANRDAKKIHALTTQLGGVKADDALLLRDPSAALLRSAFAALEKRIAGGDRPEAVFFYYSGHADEDGLLLGAERFSRRELQKFLASARADVRVAVIDACNSGAVGRSKGGKRLKQGYVIKLRRTAKLKGTVIISSSSAEEASLEIDDIGGSLFTHFWLSALRGAADRDGDAKVTVGEAFDYAYRHTLIRSSSTRSGLQHPTYRYRLAGQRSLVMSKLSRPRAALIFDRRLAGNYLVFDRASNQIVAELDKPKNEARRLLLPPGDYYIKKRLPSAVLLQKITLVAKQQHRVSAQAMRTIPYEEDVTKGRLSATFSPTWKYGAPFTRGTALTLRRGETQVGLFMPSAFGITDAITLSTQLYRDLAARPNVAAKLKFVDRRRFAFALELGAEVNLFERAYRSGDETELRLRGEGLASMRLLSSLTVTAGLGWRFVAQGKSGVGDERQAGLASLAVVLLFSENDLLELAGELSLEAIRPAAVSGGRLDVSARALYAHAWRRLRLGIGVLYPDPLAIDEKKLPLLPVVDLWWRW